MSPGIPVFGLNSGYQGQNAPFGQLFELLDQVRPFEGDSLAVVMNSVLQGEPTPILPVNPHLGELFAHTVERLLEKDPDQRFQSASGVAAELRSLKKPTTTQVLCCPDLNTLLMAMNLSVKHTAKPLNN